MPTLIEPLELPLPRLPQALDGLTLLHLTDLHARGPQRWHDQLTEAMNAMTVDLVFWTGDYMDDAGDESAAHDLVARLVQATEPRIGAAGVFGNHDTAEGRRRLEHLPVRWLSNDAWSCPTHPITVLGVNCTYGRTNEDMVQTLLAEPAPQPGADRLRILLAHLPAWLPTAADADIDLVFSGHTHGGQVRTPRHQCLYNGTDGWPLGMTTGLLQRHRTINIVSRGLGEARLEGLRVFCPRQALLVTLRCAEERSYTDRAVCLERW